ncbi:MAG: DUF1307 domain-containing protein [Coprobacillus sp.]
MNKIFKLGRIIAISALCMVLLVGCGSSDKTTTAKISSKNANGEQNIELQMIHDGETVKKQKQNAVMKFASKEIYDAFLAQMKTSGYEAIAKEYKGIEYNLTSTDSTMTVEENIVLDFSKLPAEGYKKMTNGAVKVTDPYKIDLETTVKSLKSQGYTITEEK